MMLWIDMEVRRLLIVTRLYHQLILDAEVLRLSQEKEPIQAEVGRRDKTSFRTRFRAILDFQLFLIPVSQIFHTYS